jgi:hypothetical protein
MVMWWRSRTNGRSTVASCVNNNIYIPVSYDNKTQKIASTKEKEQIFIPDKEVGSASLSKAGRKPLSKGLWIGKVADG